MNTSTALEAWKVFKNTFPAPDKYLYTLFRRRSAYTHLSGAEEAGEAGEAEVFIYTNFLLSLSSYDTALLKV